MVDIDKDKVAKRRYFACLSMLMLELLELSEQPHVSGNRIKQVLDKYKMELGADKKRCRVNLEIPPEYNQEIIIKNLHKSLLTGQKQYKSRKDKFVSFIKGLFE